MNMKGFLQNAYLHPVFKDGDDDDDDGDDEGNDTCEKESVLVPTKRQSRRNTSAPSKISGSFSPPPSFPEV